MVLQTATDYDPVTRPSADPEGHTVLSRLLAELESGALNTRILAAARLAVAEHLLQNARAQRSSIEPEDSIT